MKLRVEYRYDDESDNWNFRVPALSINGSADTREEAEREALDAVDYALETEGERKARPGGEVAYIALTADAAQSSVPVAG